MSTKLTIGYSVLRERIQNITPPVERPDWETVIVVQNPGEKSWQLADFPKLKGREDLSAEELQSIGVAKSRTRAIWLAKGEYLVFADDDIVFNEDALEAAISYLDSNPKLSLLLTQASDPSGNLRKQYPKSETKLGLLNSARAATYEMIIRVDAVRQFGVVFDENFGAGSENYLGDEYIFIADLLRAGGKGEFVPITIATHPEVSSGSGWGTDRDRIARARVFNRVFGWLAPLVRLAFGLRRLGELGGTKNLLRFVLAR
ncbi:MAG: glycosyltransferase family 2 protein [Aquiluna sp.]